MQVFCSAPWVNIHINPLVKVKPCCAWPNNFQSVDNYVLGTDKELINLKTSLANFDPPTPCQTCVEKNWYSEFDQKLINNVDDFSIKSVDARWGTTCQLSCMYCSQDWSSTWSKLISNSKSIPIHNSRIKNTESIFELFDNKISRVSMLGGEPLLLKENLRLLDIIDNDTGVEIFTNLNMNLDNNEIYQRLISRPNVNWYVSMETVKEKFEFVRRGAKWQQQVENLTKLSKTSPKSLSLQSQYCVYSAFDLVDLFDFCSQFDNSTVNLVPDNFNIRVLDIFSYPKEFKLLALDQLDRCLERYPKSAHVLMLAKEKLINSMDTVVPDIVQNCVNWHRNMESKFFNNQFDFVDLWPQFGKTQV